MKGSRARGETLSAMNRRVDFSLGMKSMASGDTSGDVYESASPPRVPREASREREREREVEALRKSLERNARASNEAGRSTSLDNRFAPGVLNRSSTDTATRWRAGSIHRNRFFGRSKPGVSDEQGLMESGMADIPEIPSRTGSGIAAGFEPRERLDPRSGMISPRAWRTNTNESNIHPPHIPVPDETHTLMGRSQTVDFEMQRLHD